MRKTSKVRRVQNQLELLYVSENKIIIKNEFSSLPLILRVFEKYYFFHIFYNFLKFTKEIFLRNVPLKYI